MFDVCVPAPKVAQAPRLSLSAPPPEDLSSNWKFDTCPPACRAIALRRRKFRPRTTEGSMFCTGEKTFNAQRRTFNFQLSATPRRTCAWRPCADWPRKCESIPLFLPPVVLPARISATEPVESIAASGGIPVAPCAPRKKPRGAGRFTRFTRLRAMDASPNDDAIDSSGIFFRCRSLKTSRGQEHPLPPDKPHNKSAATACDAKSQMLYLPDVLSYADANP
jgi:hypothetical protein